MVLSFSFIHAADIHIGRQFTGLPDYACDKEVLKLLETGTEQALNNLIETAISKNVDFVLIAGDTFDSDDHDFASKLVLKKAFQKLSDNNIKVFAVCGNHDPLNSYGRTTFNYNDTSNIKIIGLNTEPYGIFPITDRNGNQICTLRAISFKEDKFCENPLEYFHKIDDNYFNIALLHCDVNAKTDSPYAPCNLTDLQNLGCGYAALGHIHTPSEFSPEICYPGTLQGRNPKETGIHGFKYIEVENKTIIKNEFIPADVVRYDTLCIDISESEDITSAYDIILSGIDAYTQTMSSKVKLYLLRINLTGFTSFYEDIDEEFTEKTAQRITSDLSERIYIEKITNITKVKTDESVLFQDTGITGEIMKILADENAVNESYTEVIASVKPLLNKCDFSGEELSHIRSNAEKEAKEACINFCSEVYCPRKFRDKARSDVNEIFERHVRKSEQPYGADDAAEGCDTGLDNSYERSES